MNELRRPRGRARGEIVSLDESDAEASGNRVEGDAASGGAAANHEDVERVNRAGADQCRLLDRPGRNGSVQVADPLPNCRELGPTAEVVGRQRGLVEEDCTSGYGGDCGGAQSAAQASRGGHTVSSVREERDGDG